LRAASSRTCTRHPRDVEALAREVATLRAAIREALHADCPDPTYVLEVAIGLGMLEPGEGDDR